MIYDIINEIAENGSTLIKKSILEKHQNNEILKKVFLYTENKRFNYYIKINQDTDIPTDSGSDDIDDETFLCLDLLVQRKVTGNSARDLVFEHMRRLNPNAQSILARIINHDLRCNCGTSISNKVWKNLIPEYPMMLCSKYDVKATKFLEQFENKEGFIVDLKQDGGRVVAKVDEFGTVTYHSRNGNALDLFNAFDSTFSGSPEKVFDGELIVVGKNGTADRLVGNGLYTRAVKNTLTKQQAEQFTFVVWDVIDLHDFNNGVSNVTCKDRRNTLKNIISTSPKNNVQLIESKEVKTIAECVEFYLSMRDRGEEGIIIKVPSSIWEDRRSKSYVKMKNESTGDFLVKSVEFGTGRFEGLIGALVCETSCGTVKFNVGTGFTDEDRAKPSSYYDGNIVEVSYNEVISSKTKSTKSLFLPVFKCVRFDKNVANTAQELA